jgi:hypothetical protein
MSIASFPAAAAAAGKEGSPPQKDVSQAKRCSLAEGRRRRECCQRPENERKERDDRKEVPSKKVKSDKKMKLLHWPCPLSHWCFQLCLAQHHHQSRF